MVDDGSPDTSAEIIKKWQKKFPENIIYIKKENGGQASARNLGMKYVKSDWVTFIDPDDFIQYDYFEVIDVFLTNNQSKDFALVACNLLFYYEKNKKVKNKHPLKYKFNETESIFCVSDLQDHIQLSASTALFHVPLLKKHNNIFDVKIKPTFEDGHFINSFLLKVMKLEKNYFVGFIKNAKYYYRKRSDESSTLDGAWGQIERYDNQLRYGYLSLLKTSQSLLGFVPKYIQRTIIYDIFWYFKRLIDHDERISFLKNNEIKIFQDLLEEIFVYIDTETITTFNLAGISHFHKVGLIEKYKNTSIKKIIYIDDYDTVKNELTLHYFYTHRSTNTFILDEQEILASHTRIKEHHFLSENFIYEKIIQLPFEENSLMLKANINNEISTLSLGERYYKNSIYLTDIENFFNNIPQVQHSIERIYLTSKNIEIEAQVSCEEFENVDYFWSSLAGVLPHKEINRCNNLVRYQVELQRNKANIIDIEQFYAFIKNGKKVRVWKPSYHLTKEDLPQGYYFTNRYLNLSYQKHQHGRYTLFTPVLKEINYSDTSMKIEGYLFLPAEENYDLKQFKIKLSKFRDETIGMEFRLQLKSKKQSQSI